MESNGELLKNDISSAYLAKKLAPHLKTKEVRPPASARIKLSIYYTIGSAFSGTIDAIARFCSFCSHPRRYLQERNKSTGRGGKRSEAHWRGLGETAEKEEREREERLAKLGVATREEKNALVVATFAGLCLGRIIFHADACIERGDLPLEITRVKEGKNPLENTLPPIIQEIRMDDDTFQKVVALSIKDGIVCLEDPYYGVPLYKGMPRQFRFLNPDFEEQAVNILLTEIRQRIEGGAEIGVLENIAIRKEADGKIYMRKRRIR